jgi:hypothetical protein
MLTFTLTKIAQDHMRRHGYTPEDILGTIPEMLDANNPAGAVTQIDKAYRDIGGGWHDVRGHDLDTEGAKLTYPGDPPRPLIAEATLRDEKILFFNGAWIAVVQPDGAFRVARID